MISISPNAKQGGTIKRFGAKGKWQGVKKWGAGRPSRWLETGFYPVIASAAKQSIVRGKRRRGLLRCARNDVDMTSRSRGALRPRFACFVRPLSNQRAQGRPGARCTRGLVCNLRIRTRTRAYRSSGNTPAFPAQWFYGLLRALAGGQPFATVGRSLASRRFDASCAVYHGAHVSGTCRPLGLLADDLPSTQPTQH